MESSLYLLARNIVCCPNRNVSNHNDVKAHADQKRGSCVISASIRLYYSHKEIHQAQNQASNEHRYSKKLMAIVKKFADNMLCRFSYPNFYLEQNRAMRFNHSRLSPNLWSTN